MTVGQIILLFIIVITFYLGYKTGQHDGYIQGRTAVRKYYETKASQ